MSKFGLRGLSFASSIAAVGLALVAVVALAFAGYTYMNPQVVTVTQQQFVTNTQSIYSTQSVTTVQTVTGFTTATSTTTAGNVYGGGQYYQYCSYNGCYFTPPAYASIDNVCQSTGENNTYQCSGYLHQASSTCIELAIPYINPAILESTGYLYLTLYNLPSNHPPSGTWVTITGQINQGYAPGPYGEFCSGNSMTVESISQ